MPNTLESELTKGIEKPANAPLDIGETRFDPTGGEGGIPSLTVGGDNRERGAIERFLEKSGQAGGSLDNPDASVLFPIASSIQDSESIRKNLRNVGGVAISDVGVNLGTAVLSTGMAALEVLGLPTRFIGAAVKNINPLASKEDKNKTFIEAFSDPESSLFKEARLSIRESDMPTIIKLIGEFALSIGEDPGFIFGATRRAVTSPFKALAKRKLAKGTETFLLKDANQAFGKKGVLLPSEKVNLPFTQAQKQLVSKGTVDVNIAKKEIRAVANNPGALATIDKSRMDNIVAGFATLAEKNGIKGVAGDEFFERVSKSVDDIVSGFRKNKDLLYEPINKIAGPELLTNNVSKDIKAVFEKNLIFDPKAKKLFPTTGEIEAAIARAREKGVQIGFQGGAPVNAKTGESLIATSKVKSFGDIGLDDEFGNVLFAAKKSLLTDGTDLSTLIFRKRAISRASKKASSAGDKRSAMILGDVSNDLETVIQKQIFESTGRRDLVDQWITANAFIKENAAGLKAAEGLMFTKATKNVGARKRTATEILNQFDKINLRKKGRVIDSMLPFFDEKGLQGLRQLFLNDIVDKAVAKGFSGKALMKIVNDLPEDVLNKVLTSDMKKDLSGLFSQVLANDKALSLTRAKLGTFTVADKQALIKTLNSTVSYRMLSLAMGITRPTLQALKPVAAAGAVMAIVKKQSIKSAENFLKTGESIGPVRLVLKSFIGGGIKGGAASGFVPVTANITRRNINENVSENKEEQEQVNDKELRNRLFQGINK